MKTSSTRSTSKSSYSLYLALINLLLTLFLFIWIFLKDSKPDVAYVDALKLMNQYKGVEDARKGLEKRNLELEANLDTLKKEVELALAEYKLNVKASNREKTLLEKVVIAKQEQLINYEQSVKQQYEKQDQEMSVKLMNKVNDYIKRYGEQHGYKIILAATQYGNIAYGEEGFDLTEEIVLGLNQEYLSIDGKK